MSDRDFFDELAGRPAEFDPTGHADDTEWALIRKMTAAAVARHEGGPLPDPALLARFRDDCPGQRWPNLAWLHGQVDLAVLFGRRRVPFQSEALADIAKRFTKTPCYAGWAEVVAEYEAAAGEPPDRPVALAFRWPGWGDLVLHDRPDDLPEEGVFVVRYHAGRRFVIEPTGGFLARLRWPRPEDWV